MAFEREVETLPILSDELKLDPVLAHRARRTVALREEMTGEERYELLEMLGLIDHDSACGEAGR